MDVPADCRSYTITHNQTTWQESRLVDDQGHFHHYPLLLERRGQRYLTNDAWTFSTNHVARIEDRSSHCHGWRFAHFEFDVMARLVAFPRWSNEKVVAGKAINSQQWWLGHRATTIGFQCALASLLWHVLWTNDGIQTHGLTGFWHLHPCRPTCKAMGIGKFVLDPLLSWKDLWR